MNFETFLSLSRNFWWNLAKLGPSALSSDYKKADSQSVSLWNSSRLWFRHWCKQKIFIVLAVSTKNATRCERVSRKEKEEAPINYKHYNLLVEQYLQFSRPGIRVSSSDLIDKSTERIGNFFVSKDFSSICSIIVDFVMIPHGIFF